MLPRDGSGLGRQNVVTARAMVGLLRWATASRRTSFGGPPSRRAAARNVTEPLADVSFWGKTGSLNRVAALSGYLRRRDGTELAVSVIVNHYAAPDADVRTAMDAWVRSLVE